MIVRLSERAFADLEEIGDWIAADNPSRAVSFVEDIVARCRSLARHPQRFPIVREIGDHVVRKLTWRGYIILYRVTAQGVDIARIVHGARDWTAIIDEGA